MLCARSVNRIRPQEGQGVHHAHLIDSGTPSGVCHTGGIKLFKSTLGPYPQSNCASQVRKGHLVHFSGVETQTFDPCKR